MLIHSEWAAWVRDNYSWKMYGRDSQLRAQTNTVMHQLGVTGTCQPSTFIQAIGKSLRNLKREARQKIKEERLKLQEELYNREQRDNQRGSK